MTSYTVGYFVGSLSAQSINRILSKLTLRRDAPTAAECTCVDTSAPREYGP